MLTCRFQVANILSSRHNMKVFNNYLSLSNSGLAK